MRNRLNILYQFNEKYVPYAGVSIYSVLCHNKHTPQICIYIMGENLSKDAVIMLKHLVTSYHREVVFINTKSLVEKMRELDLPTYRGSYAANMRLFLDEVLDESVQRILYLDSDTIVVAPLDGLFGLCMQDRAIGMVLDSLGYSHKKQIGLTDADDYFNSGVILFDLSKWKKENYSEKIVRHIVKRRNNYPAPDQDLLNIVCRNDIFRLDLKYNYQPIHAAFSDKLFWRIMHPAVYYDVTQIEESRKDIVIYHCFRFLGEFPWHKENLHPFNKVFANYLEHSPWKDYKIGRAHV